MHIPLHSSDWSYRILTIWSIWSIRTLLAHSRCYIGYLGGALGVRHEMWGLRWEMKIYMWYVNVTLPTILWNPIVPCLIKQTYSLETFIPEKSKITGATSLMRQVKTIWTLNSHFLWVPTLFIKSNLFHYTVTTNSLICGLRINIEVDWSHTNWWSSLIPGCST